MERFPEALPKLRHAVDLDPLSLPSRASLGLCYFLSRHFDESLSELEAALEIDSNFAVAHHIQSWAYMGKRMWSEAIAAARRAVELSARDPFRLAGLGVSLANSNRRAEAEEILEEIQEASTRRYVSALETAYLRAALGDLDGAMNDLERAVTDRTAFLVLLRVNPSADPFRAHPRFPEILRRVGHIA